MLGYTAQIKKNWKVYKHSLKCKNLEVEFDSSSWSIFRNNHSQIDVLQNKLLKIFENFTRKHLCWSLFLVTFIKKRRQHRLFQVKFANFLWIFFYRTPLVAALYSVRTLSILAMRILILILEDSMWLQVIYLLNAISF